MENSRLRTRNPEKARFWSEHLERWQRSGLSQKSYCLQHNLKWPNFHYWRKKLGQPAKSRLRLVPQSAPWEGTSQCTTPTSESRQLRIHLHHITLEVDEAIEPRVLKGIVGALVASCGA